MDTPFGQLVLRCRIQPEHAQFISENWFSKDTKEIEHHAFGSCLLDQSFDSDDEYLSPMDIFHKNADQLCSNPLCTEIEGLHQVHKKILLHWVAINSSPSTSDCFIITKNCILDGNVWNFHVQCHQTMGHIVSKFKSIIEGIVGPVADHDTNIQPLLECTIMSPVSFESEHELVFQYKDNDTSKWELGPCMFQRPEVTWPFFGI